MPKLYSYTPVIIDGPNGTDYRPLGEGIQELSTIDNIRYVVIEDLSSVLIPDEILATFQEVNLTETLKTTIKKDSRACQLIQEQFLQEIRRYHSLDDELYYARISSGLLLGTYQLLPGEAELLEKYQTDVEAARTNLHNSYMALGLSSAK